MLAKPMKTKGLTHLLCGMGTVGLLLGMYDHGWCLAKRIWLPGFIPSSTYFGHVIPYLVIVCVQVPYVFGLLTLLFNFCIPEFLLGMVCLTWMGGVDHVP